MVTFLSMKKVTIPLFWIFLASLTHPKDLLMKASLPLSVILCLLCSFSLQAQWDRQYPLDNLDDVLDIDISLEGFGFAAGPNDMIVRYEHATKSWELLPGYGENWN